MRKRTFLAICFIVLVFAAIGCRRSELNTEEQTRIIIDASGREVEIPEIIDSIIPLANALRMMCYAQAQDLVVGVESGEKERTLIKAYNWINYDNWENLPIVGEGASGIYIPYEEVIVNVDPDVILCGYDKESAEELQTKTGIPVVVINTGTLFEDDYDESLRIIGEVCGKEARCEEIIRYIQAVSDDLKNRTKDIKNEDKPTVYAGAVTFKGSHGIEGTYANYPPFLAVNAKSIYETTDAASTGVTIDKELILKKNPDIIFLDPNNLSYVSTDYQNNPGFYTSLRAFQTGAVYAMPSYNLYHTNVEIALADCYYAGTVIFPEHFKDVNPVEKAKEIFAFMLGTPDYYQWLEDAGFGFGALSIGD